MERQATKEKRVRISQEEFMVGILCALSKNGVGWITRRHNRFDRQMESAFLDISTKENLHPRFRIQPHPIHGDSNTIHESLYSAALLGLISFEGEDIRLKIPEEIANKLLETIPGGEQLFRDLVQKFPDIN